MKKFRFSLPLLALVLGIAVSAFTKSTVSPDAVAWEYLGPAGEENIASHYSLLTGSPTFQCGGSATVCTIMAEDNSGEPDLQGKNPLTDPGFQTIKRAIQ